MERIIIGVDPHKLSATIEVVDEREQLLGSGRFTTDKTGYASMLRYVKAWPDRTWAVEGANGTSARQPSGQRRSDPSVLARPAPASKKRVWSGP